MKAIAKIVINLVIIITIAVLSYTFGKYVNSVEKASYDASVLSTILHTMKDKNYEGAITTMELQYVSDIKLYSEFYNGKFSRLYGWMLDVDCHGLLYARAYWFENINSSAVFNIVHKSEKAEWARMSILACPRKFWPISESIEDFRSK